MPNSDRTPHPASDSAAVLRDEHVFLRPLRAEDAPQLEEILREPEVPPWWGGDDGDARGIDEIFEDPDAVPYASEPRGR